MRSVASPMANHLLRTAARQRSLTELAAPILVGAYFVISLNAFMLLLPLPGLVQSFLLPVSGVIVLALTPVERLEQIPVPLSLAGFILWSTLSYFWATDPMNAFFALRSGILPIAVVVAVAGTVPARRLIQIILYSSVAITCWSLVSSVLLPASRAAGGPESAFEFQGTFGHKNDFGVFAVLTLTAALPLLRGRFRPYLLFVIVVGIISTRSATAGSGLLTIVFIWSWMLAISRGRSERDRRILKAISLTSGLVALFSVLRLMPVLLAVYDKDVTFSGRTIIWAESLAVIGDRPLIGYGPGGVFGLRPTDLTVDLWREIGFAAAHTHNGVLETLIEVGVIGLVLLVAFIVSIYVRASRVSSVESDRPVGQWAVLFMTSLLVMSLAEPLLSPAYLGYMGLLWVILSKTHQDQLRPVEPAERRLELR